MLYSIPMNHPCGPHSDCIDRMMDYDADGPVDCADMFDAIETLSHIGAHDAEEDVDAEMEW